MPATLGAPLIDTVLWNSGSGSISVTLGGGVPVRAIWFPELPAGVTLSFADHATGNVFYSLTDTGAERIDVPSLGTTGNPITQVDITASPNISSNLYISFTNFAWQPFKSGSTGSGTGNDLGFFNVLDYGAKNDGSVDCTDAWQKADIAAYLAGGGTVWGPHGLYFFNGGSGTVPNPAPPSGNPLPDCPIGPVLIHNNVHVQGSGMWSTLCVQGPNYYLGTIERPSPTGGPPTSTNAATLFANNGYWTKPGGTTTLSANCALSDLSIQGNGHLAPGAGDIEPSDQNIILSNAVVEFHLVTNGYIDRLNVFDTYGNGIINYGLNEPPTSSVPTLGGHVNECVVNLNYPAWLSGSSWFDHPGQPGGSLPIRTVGCDVMEVTKNIVGILNVGRTNDPFLPGNTNDAIDCPTTSNLLLQGNYVTLCGDGLGTNGLQQIIIDANLVIGAGSVGIASYKSVLGSASSQITIGNNLVIQAGSNGPANPCLNIDSGSMQLTCSNNIFMSAFGVTPAIVNFLGDNITFIDNYIGMMGTANSIGLRLSGNLVNSTIQGNIIDFGGASTSVGLKLGSCSAVSILGNVFANAAPSSTSIGISLPAANTYDHTDISHNIFDSTLDSDSGNTPLSIGVAFSSITKCLFVPNIGISGAWLNSTYNQAPVTPSPNPPFTAPFTNPWPWPASVWIGPSGVFTGPVILDGVTTVAGTTAPTAGGFVARVPASSTIALQWSTKPTGGWLWIFEAN